MMGKAALQLILEDIQDNSGFFGLIADQSGDISNKKTANMYTSMGISVRYDNP